MRLTVDMLGQWNDISCTDEIPFTCYLRKDASLPVPAPTSSPIGCPAGYYTSIASRSCFKLMNTPMSWNDARASCQAQGETHFR